MADLHFEWDVRKARANLRKHGVSFDEAESVFYDDEALSWMTRSTLTTRTASSCLA